MSKGIKRIMREILFRPLNILLLPILSIVYFFVWITSQDEDWKKWEKLNLNRTIMIWDL